jgi:hypothetical protein
MAMALDTWDALQEGLGLLGLGYTRIIWTHVSCVAHGTFKVAIAEEMDVYVCPECAAPCKMAVIAQGFTRREFPPPELIDKPLSARTWEILLMTADEKIRRPKRIFDRHRNKSNSKLVAAPQACDSRPRARPYVPGWKGVRIKKLESCL